MTDLQVEAPRGSLRAGLEDISNGMRRREIWWGLSWAQIKSQYRRTYLGPWWLTARVGILVLGLAFLFGILFQQDLRIFLPYVAIGFVAFNWMSGMIILGSTSMTSQADQIRSTPGPLSILVLRGVASSTIQFGHDCVVILIVLVAFRPPVTWTILVVPIAFALILANGFAVGLWLGPVAARFRDVGPMVISAVQVLFFFTPIFWVPSQLSLDQRVALSVWNPLAYLLEFFRAPLLGTSLSLWVVLGAFGLTIANIAIGVLAFSVNRNRIAYWI